jgi:superfamily II DNA or RNA helicase
MLSFNFGGQPAQTKRQSFKLRPYQQEAIDAANKKFADGARSLLMVLPTGAGKTICLSHMCRQRMDAGRSMILVHRDELIRQAAQKIEDICGVKPGIDKAEERSTAHDQIVVASVQTLIRRKNLPGDPFNFVIVDECHHCCLDNTYGKVLAQLQPNELLGVTATPWRSDKIALSGVFEDTAYSLSLMDLINQKFLSDITVKSLPVNVDLSGVRVKQGDLSEGDLGAVLEPHLNALADVVARDYSDRKMLSFCPLRDTSRLWTQKLAERGLAAEHVDGESKDRKDILKRFTNNDTRFLSNASLLLEGYDEPSIDTIFILRPTKSRVLMSQLIGRGTRLFPGKKELLVLDPCFISERHNIISVADLNAEDDKHAKAVKKFMEKGKSLSEATEEERVQRREALAEALRKNAHRSAYEKKIAELSYALDIQALEDWEPVYKWHRDKPSDKQIAVLEKAGVDLSVVQNKGMASVLLEGMSKRRDGGLATLKQVRFLARLGHANPDKVLFKDVDAEVTKLRSGKVQTQVAA